MMTKERLPEELADVLAKTRLKRPPESLMAAYFSEVNAKIKQARAHHSHSRLLSISFAIIFLAVAGVGFWYFVFYPKMITPPKLNLPDHAMVQTQKAVPSASVQENMEILESLDPEGIDESEIL